MSTRVEKTIMVNVPVSRAYNQWTQFEEFPHFMGGVESVTQLSDDRLDWVAEIAGVRRRWEARITEQVPDRKIAWAATEGATNAGAVMFDDVGGEQTTVTLVLEYEPEGLVEKAGDSLNIIERQAEGDLERFKSFIEDEGYATGAWRGSVGTPGQAGVPDADDAAASRGDSGKAGVSPKAVAGGLGVAAATAAAVAATKQRSGQPASAPEADTASGGSSTPQADTGTRMLTDEEIDAAASTDPYVAGELDAEPDLDAEPALDAAPDSADQDATSGRRR
jgi:ribosome-associated toxin RatA of RatAB toxin-antitoxin module